MEDQPMTGDSEHNYSSPALGTRSNPTNLGPNSFTHTNLEQVSTFLPRQAPIYIDSRRYYKQLAEEQRIREELVREWHLKTQHLLHYDTNIVPRRGGQTTSPKSALPAQNVQGGPRTRSASKVSNKKGGARQASPSCHASGGNHNKTREADRELITGKNTPSKMQNRKPDFRQQLPPKPKQSGSPSNLPPHPNSVPSTPQQHARKFSFESRDHSPNANTSHSPRSAYSEANGAVPSLRPLPPRQGVCKFETGLKHSRRRMPYSSDEMLEKVDLQTIKSKLSEEDERKLSTDMRELYDRLQPTGEVEEKRQKLVQKLEKLLNDAWPGHDIRVHLFGSSGNLLCSDDSDVDICIVTPWKELEGVCMLAELLAKRGMEKVVCVSSAKVPIVKIWDPELKLSCDMNVNNTLALENTRMIKTYVQIDERVRPLAMIIKYWTRRRKINDAAYGGTLSSYTWICMIIAFLQLRQPPILPALHQRPHQKLPREDGEMASFADDINQLRGFGDENKSSLGELLFQFFLFYAHEVDYRKDVLSVRLGKIIPKENKNWHMNMTNQLCVEEPFNVGRNLGNTADSYAFRGIHLELRRAFDLIVQGKLDECCDQYVFPKEEERIYQKPAQTSRPAVLLRSASHQQSNRGSRGGSYRNGNRQGQHRNNGNNNSNNNSRRASSSIQYDNNGNAMVFPEYQVAMTPQGQFIYVQDPNIMQAFSALAMQQNNINFLQYAQNAGFNVPPTQMMQGNASQTQPSSAERSRTNSFDTPPLSAPLRPDVRTEMYNNYHQAYLHNLQTFYLQQQGYMYPPSPSTNHTGDFRRSSHRTTNGSDSGHSLSGSTMRSQSQPASRTAPGVPTAQGITGANQIPTGMTSIPARHVNGAPMPSFIPDEAHDNEQNGSTATTPPEEERSYSYYADPSSPPRRTSVPTSNIPAFGDINTQAPNQSRGRLSSDQLPQSILDRIKQNSRSPSPMGHNRGYSMGRGSAPLASAPFPAGNGSQARDTTPLVVNGSMSKLSNGNSPRQPTQGEIPVGQYAGYDNPLHINQRLDASSSIVTETPFTNHSTPGKGNSPTSDRPVVVNGSSNAGTFINNQLHGSQFSHDVGMAPSGYQQVAVGHDVNGNLAGAYPNSFQRYRPLPGQLVALDLETGNHVQSSEFPHLSLSPVYEANSPSPNLTRRPDIPFEQPAPAFSVPPYNHPGLKAESTKGKQKSSIEASSSRHEGFAPSNPRVNGLARENGHTRGAKSESDNTGNRWQKMSRGKKKADDSKPRGDAYPQSEQLPKNDSERKGG